MATFRNLEEQEIIEAVQEQSFDDDIQEECDKGELTLSICEEFATLNYLPENNQAVNDSFEQSLSKADKELGHVTLRCMYNEFIESLQRNGQIHELQASNYTYQGWLF